MKRKRLVWKRQNRQLGGIVGAILRESSLTYVEQKRRHRASKQGFDLFVSYLKRQ